MALSDCNQLAHVISSLANTKVYVTVPFLLCFILYLRAISKYKPPGAYIRRCDLTEGFWCYDVGAYIWRGLFLEYYGMLSFKEYEILSSTTMQVFSYININLLIFFMPNLKIDFIRQWKILVRPY